MIASQRVPEIEPRKRARHLSPPKLQAGPQGSRTPKNTPPPKLHRAYTLNPKPPKTAYKNLNYTDPTPQTPQPGLLCEASKAELTRRAGEEYEFVTKCDTKHSEAPEKQGACVLSYRA